MPLERLDLTQRGVAAAVLELQRRAYRIEAELIGSDEIPQLSETLEQLQASGETFLGAYLEGTSSGRSPGVSTPASSIFIGSWSIRAAFELESAPHWFGPRSRPSRRPTSLSSRPAAPTSLRSSSTAARASRRSTKSRSRRACGSSVSADACDASRLAETVREPSLVRKRRVPPVFANAPRDTTSAGASVQECRLNACSNGSSSSRSRRVLPGSR